MEAVQEPEIVVVVVVEYNSSTAPSILFEYLSSNFKGVINLWFLFFFSAVATTEAANQKSRKHFIPLDSYSILPNAYIYR